MAKTKVISVADKPRLRCSRLQMPTEEETMSTNRHRVPHRRRFKPADDGSGIQAPDYVFLVTISCNLRSTESRRGKPGC